MIRLCQTAGKAGNLSNPSMKWRIISKPCHLGLQRKRRSRWSCLHQTILLSRWPLDDLFSAWCLQSTSLSLLLILVLLHSLWPCQEHGNVCLGILNGTEAGLEDFNIIGGKFSTDFHHSASRGSVLSSHFPGFQTSPWRTWWWCMITSCSTSGGCPRIATGSQGLKHFSILISSNVVPPAGSSPKILYLSVYEQLGCPKQCGAFTAVYSPVRYCRGAFFWKNVFSKEQLKTCQKDMCVDSMYW